MARAAAQVRGRRYDSQQACPVARTLDLVGDRWTILILRDLAFGDRRFVDLQTSLEGIAPNLLTARLKGLEAGGMVRRVAYSERPPRARYKLTDLGRDSSRRCAPWPTSATATSPDQRHATRGMAGGSEPLEQP